jgi:hypothetical protein
MNDKCNNNLIKTLELTEELKKIAHNGLSDSNDDNCILLYGIIQDYCYKIKSEVEREINRHKKTNKWT